MVKHFKIHDSFIHTNYGVGALDHLRPELATGNLGYTLLERFVLFLKLKGKIQNAMISDDLQPYAQRFKLSHYQLGMPDSIQQVLELLTPEPVWLLAASELNDGLIGLMISLDPEGPYSITESESQAQITLGVELDRPTNQIEAFNLAYTSFTVEQQIVLALLGAQALNESEIFQASMFGLIDKQQKFLLKYKTEKTPNLEPLLPHFYQNPRDTAAVRWLKKLEAAKLKDPGMKPDLINYDQFTTWAELWLKDEKTAVSQLKDQPPSVFLVQALALHAEPKLFEQYAENLISLNNLSIQEPIALMFGQQPKTRKGLSTLENDKFYAFDPAHIRALCSNLASDHRQQRIKTTQDCTGIAIDYWRRCENH